MPSRDRDYQGQRGYGREANVEREGSDDYRNQTSRDRGYASGESEYGGYGRGFGPSGYGGQGQSGDYRSEREASYGRSGDRGEAGDLRDEDFRRFNPYRGDDYSRNYGGGDYGRGQSGGYGDRVMRGQQGQFDQSYGGRPQGYDTSQGWREQQGNLGYERGGGQSYSQNYNRQAGYDAGQRHGQAHDPDYAQWRDEQVRNLDNDYDSWRQDRYKKFSDEFNTWRSSRTGQSGQGGQAASAHGGASMDKASDKSSDKSGSSDHANNTRK